MSNAIPGIGVVFQKGDGGSPEAFVTISEVRDINGPQLSTAVVDVTNQSSPNATEEILATLKQLGQVTFDINWQPGHVTHNATTGLLADWISRAKRHFRLTWPDGITTWSFTAFVVGMSPTSPVADALRMSVTLRVTGENLTLV